MLKHDVYDADNNKLHVAMRNFYRNQADWYLIKEAQPIYGSFCYLIQYSIVDSMLKRKKFGLLSNTCFVYYFIING